MRRGPSGNEGRKTRLRRKVEEEGLCRGGKIGAFAILVPVL